MYSSLMAEVMRREKEMPERRRAMCEQIRAIEERAEARGEARGEQRGIEIGEARGEQRGIEIGEARGEKRGKAQGEENAIVNNIRYIMDGLKYTAKEAMDLLRISDDDQKKYKALL